MYTPLLNNFIIKQPKCKNLRQLTRLLLDQISKGGNLFEQPGHMCKCLACSKATEKSTSKLDITIPYNKSLTHTKCQLLKVPYINCILTVVQKAEFLKNHKSNVNLTPFLKQFQNMRVFGNIFILYFIYYSFKIYIYLYYKSI